MKNLLLPLFLCFCVSNYGQYTTITETTLKFNKDITADYKEIGLHSKDDCLFANILINPNSVKGFVNIKNAVLDKITVYDNSGRLQKTFVILTNGEDHVMDLTQLSKGVYFIVLESGKTIAKRKIIIN
ncbi:T9SS type A sorting domain-containing protein [Flavobacterium piscis]|uniref:Secretion system C-terminal sorting domain-containing protein n=1 Tax=Flavobacterium piscis TaxID=1114874 RepID=A0ABU1YCX6_9FLAO|nr:T9SS type A sorting domain-containing protein [Flavobacterium piscis]MDR7212093.1 hypothetical protein [Flavobacterium piscis]